MYIYVDIYIYMYIYIYIYIYIFIYVIICYIYNAYSFDLLSSNNFSKWIKFEYGGNMCTWLHMHS